MPEPARKTSAWAAVHRIVRRIPRGRVMTYGQIAKLVAGRLSARAVGWAMSSCPDDVPWQRVVNARGACSTDDRADLPPGLQRALLEREGIEFRGDGTLDLARYRHAPREPRGPGKPRPARGRRSIRSGR